MKLKHFPDGQHSYAGSDIIPVIVFPTLPDSSERQKVFQSTNAGLSNLLNAANSIIRKDKADIHILGNIQTISISYTSSVFPVRRLGERTAKFYNKGARSFAGTIIFTHLNEDIFYMASKIYGSGNSDLYYLDDIPPFNIIINASNEYGESAIKVIYNVTLTHAGTAHSVDDLFTEHSVTYIAEHVTPFFKITDVTDFLLSNPNKVISTEKMPEAVDYKKFLEEVKDTINGSNTYKVNTMTESARSFNLTIKNGFYNEDPFKKLLADYERQNSKDLFRTFY